MGATAMRILRLMPRIGPTSAPYTQFTLPRLSQHTVTLCTFFPGEPPPDRRLDYREGTGGILGFMTGLWPLLRQRPFDVVHVHAPQMGFMFLIVALLARARLLSRTVMHVHGSYATYRRTDRWLLLPMFLCCGRVVCCSHASRRSFPWWYRFLAGRRFVTICHGVDLDHVDRLWPYQAAIVGTEPQPLNLVTVGRLHALKNHATVIRALAQATTRSARLTVIGDGPLLEPLRTLVEDLGLQARVIFTGKIPRDQTLQRLWDADGFISMSYGEGLPLAVLEAMGCFCPVVLSDIPPHREIRGRREDLIPLLRATDVTALARAIDAWDRMPADVRRCWGADCRLHIEHRFALPRMLNKLDDLFDELSPAATPEWEIFRRCLLMKPQRQVRRHDV
jgi:glycosyltransferase involved in cell wall biosynthesis